MSTVEIKQPNANTSLLICRTNSSVKIEINQPPECCAIILTGDEIKQLDNVFPGAGRADAHDLIDRVVSICGISRVRLLSANRQPDTVRCRRFCSWLLRNKLNLSLPQTAALLNMKTHASVINQLRYLERHPGEMAELERVRLQL